MPGPTDARRAAVFLDRDGTVIEERNYLADPEQVQLIPGAAAALRTLARSGFALVIVTNQSGIGRGLYSEVDFQAVQSRLLGILDAAGVTIDAVYHCPHHPDFTGACSCRKPQTGLFRQAAAQLGIDLTRSAYVGDRSSDVAAARELGGLGVLVLTGYGVQEAGALLEGTRVAVDLTEAASLILEWQLPASLEVAG